MTFKPTILTKTENRELRWSGKVLIKGLFIGNHSFELMENVDGTTKFFQSEKFTGILVWLFDPEKTKNGFEEMNRKLKELAEEKLPN